MRTSLCLSAVPLVVALLSACQTTTSATIDSEPLPPGTRRDELMVVLQVCRPDRLVEFEDIKVDLRGYPKAKTIIQARLSNSADISMYTGWNEAALANEPDPDAVVVRRLISASQVDADRSTQILAGEITNYSPGPFSAGSGPPMSLWGSTSKNQPVYEGTKAHYREIVAINIAEVAAPKPQRSRAMHWFQIPPVSVIPIGSFSPWQSPISTESDDQSSRNRSLVSWDPVNGRGTKLNDVAAELPWMRFMLTTQENYYNQNRFWERMYPWLVKNYYETSGPSKLPEFVPASKVSIPPC